MEKIRLGISACLLGENVRYDGGHALDLFLRDTLGTYIRYVPVCPEVECGFGVPRETLRLTGNPERPLRVASKAEGFPRNAETTFHLGANGHILDVPSQRIPQKEIQCMPAVVTDILPEKAGADAKAYFFHELNLPYSPEKATPMRAGPASAPQENGQ
jgi:hypothetical protein